MTIDDALAGVVRLYLDTAPVVYFAERNARYTDRVDRVFNRFDEGRLAGVTSVITLAECLVHPVRDGATELADLYKDLLTRGQSMSFLRLRRAVAYRAAELRAICNLNLIDALQAAAAIEYGCDALLTNDYHFQRVTGIRVLVLDELTA
jgi:predicted nucleic acid-binding protein